MAKGKANEGQAVGMRSMPGNPCDGHTVNGQIEQIDLLTGTSPKCRRRTNTPHGLRIQSAPTSAAC